MVRTIPYLLIPLLLSGVVGCNAPSRALIEYRECKAVETAMFYDMCRSAYELRSYTWVQDTKGPVRRDKEGYPINNPSQMQQEMAFNHCHLYLQSACGPRP